MSKNSEAVGDVILSESSEFEDSSSGVGNDSDSAVSGQSLDGEISDPSSRLQGGSVRDTRHAKRRNRHSETEGLLESASHTSKSRRGKREGPAPFEMARKTASGIEVVVPGGTRVVVQDESVVTSRKPESPVRRRKALKGREAEEALAKLSLKVVPLAKASGPSKALQAMARRDADGREPTRMANRLVESSSARFGRESKLRR